jgi:hypothetical protein
LSIRPTAAACVACCFAVTASAQDAPSSSAALPQSIRRCIDIDQDLERLACYDAAASRPAERRSSQATAEQSFGAAPGRTDPKRGEEVSSIQARVAALRERADGSLVIELENGQAWSQEEVTTLLLKVGDVVTISRGALRSYRLVTPTRRSARVKRIR